MTMYMPGTHIITTLESGQLQLLQKGRLFKQKADELVQQFGLQKLGEVYHDFSPQGFTAVICLSESHLSIHTWPEYGRLNMDIYLSNHLKNNDGTVSQLFESIVSFFEATIVHKEIIRR